MASKDDQCGSGCLFAQPQTEDISSISYPRRFVIYIVGVIETLLFGGCIFGWAQLVHVLKTEEVFLDLCHGFNNGTLSSNSSGLTDQQILRGCDAQSQEYAFIYAIACVVFGLPAFLMGMVLHYCGLAAGRFIGSILLTTGFISLSCTTKETPNFLYAAMMCLAVGGNQMRMAGYQFCDLFPTYRATALSIISGSYAASAALFMVFQVGRHFGISVWGVSTTLAGIAAFSIPMTFLMPWNHIPNRDAEIAKESKKSSISLKTSLLSVSSLTHNVWYTVNFFITTSYALAFNSWISSIAETTEEAGRYSLMYSLSCLASPFMSPFPGMLMDFLARTTPDASEKERVFRRIRSTIIPIAFVTVLSLLLRISLFFKDPKAIYCSLVFLVLLRTWAFPTATTFLKNRFPPEHFIRMAGIQSSVSCTIDFMQYYIFIWSQKDFEASMIFLICLVCLTFVHALHILPKKNLQKIVDNLFQPSERSLLLNHK